MDEDARMRLKTGDGVAIVDRWSSTKHHNSAHPEATAERQPITGFWRAQSVFEDASLMMEG